MSSLFDRLFKSQTQQQRFGKLYESFLKSKRRSRFQTEKTYRVKSSTSLIDKTKFLYDIPDSMIFPNTSDIDETEENADVFLKEFGDLLDKDYYLPESILNLLGLSHLIENNGNTEDQKSNEDSAKSADVSKSNQPNEFTNTTANKSSSRSVVSTNSNSSKNNSGNDFNDIMIKINSLKRKFNTNNDKQGMFGPPSKNIKKNIDSTSDPKTKNPSSNSNTTSTDELEIICETAPNTSKFSVIGTPKRRINFVKNRKSFPKICLPQRIKLGKKGARQVQDKGPNSLSDNIIQSTQRLIETQSINNKESDQIMTNSNVSNQNEVHSPSLLNKVAKVPTNTIKNNQVSQSLQNKVSNLSAKSMEHKPGKSKSPSPKKKKRKSIQSVDQNQMWKNVNMMFNHILDQMKINSEAHHMSVHNVAKFTGNNVIPNNLNEMENNAMFSIPPCDIIGNEAVDVNISSISHNTLDESRQELVSCITDPFYNQREELDKKPNVATNSNDNNKDEGPLSNTRRPVIFLKDPSLLLKEPETRTRKSDESTFIENASGAKDKASLQCTESESSTVGAPRESSTSETSASSSNIPEVLDSGVTQSSERFPSVEVDETHATVSTEQSESLSTESHQTDHSSLFLIPNDEDTEVTNHSSQTRDGSTTLTEDSSPVDGEVVDKINQARVDYLKKILELNTQMMKILKSQNAQLEKLKKSNKSCEKCSKISGVLHSRDISAEQKISILHSMY